MSVSERYKSSFVAIVGRPSAGKSSLLNAFCGRKVSIVSPVPQTTRSRVRGIVTTERGQLVFVDTPGFHTSARRMNAHMMELVTESLTDVEVALYVVDSTREPGEEEDTLAASVARFDGPVVCAVNKVDAAASRPEQLEEFVTTRLPRAQLRRVSAATGDGTAELLDALFDVAPIGEQMYPEEYYTDQDPEFRVGEIIREKAIAHLRQELPHSLFVDVADMEVQDGVLWIRAFLIVERESQKGIVVGRGGSGIKNIRIAAKREIKELFPYEGTRLDLRVKVYKGWRKSEAILKRVVR